MFEELKAQLAPATIEIPGFAPHTTMNVKLRRIDFTVAILETSLANPIEAEIVAAIQKNPGKAGQVYSKKTGKQQMVGFTYELARPIMERYAQRALVEPSWDELKQAKREALAGLPEEIVAEEVEHPLYATQLSAIFNWLFGVKTEYDPLSAR